jgi:glycosyltransferase involved in cell wall biosynthesis
LAIALTDLGVEVGLWASDRSAVSTPLLPSTSGVQRLAGTVSGAVDHYKEVNILHDNGLWLSHNHRLAILAERRGIPRVVSTRGMLEPWALSHKRWKKRLAWRLYQERDLIRADYHLTSSEVEAHNLRQFGLGVPIATIPNGVDIPENLSDRVIMDTQVDDRRRRTALFLGRIYPIKGLPMLIEAWARVKPKEWMLRIAGPDEGGHQKQVERAVSAAGLGDVVSFVGPIESDMKESAFLDADLFVLPTHSESFGMVVAEALAHGLPVLTTTAAPWLMLREKSCGWWVEPTVDGIVEGLREATRLDRGTLRAMGARGRALVGTEFTWKHVAEQTLFIYEELLNKGTRLSNHRCLQPV